MIDRVPSRPGRVLITPETGTPFYAEMEMADEPYFEGTPWSKETVLQDDTVLALGLVPSADVTPNDAFMALITHPNTIGRRVWYASSVTANSTTAKIITLTTGQPTFVRHIGTTIVVAFTNGNSAAFPTMNIGGTGVANIRFRGTTTGGPDLWRSGQRVMFVWDGTGWEIINPIIRPDMATSTVIGETEFQRVLMTGRIW